MVRTIILDFEIKTYYEKNAVLLYRRPPYAFRIFSLRQFNS